MQLAPFKLVTIITESVLSERITRDLARLGAKGFTATEVRGEGSRHIRSGEIPGQNVKIESVVNAQVAELVVAHVAQAYFSNYAAIVYISDVLVVRGDKYV